jgi:hypothetical protein
MDDLQDPEVSIDLVHEFYLRSRDDPYQARFTISVDAEAVEAISEVGVLGLMETAQRQLDEMLFTKGATTITLVDSRSNMQTVLIEEIQAVSILAPDDETIMKIVEG